MTIHLPGELRRVWRWFSDLNEVRRYFRLGEKTLAERISFGELVDWQACHQVWFEAWQLAAISLVDEFFVKVFNDPDGYKAPPSRALTPELFDALFGK